MEEKEMRIQQGREEGEERGIRKDNVQKGENEEMEARRMRRKETERDGWMRNTGDGGWGGRVSSHQS